MRRGAEMVTVMTPLLASAALDQYLARVRFGSVELTGLEKRVLQAAHKLVQEKKKPGNHAIHALVGGSYTARGHKLQFFTILSLRAAPPAASGEAICTLADQRLLRVLRTLAMTTKLQIVPAPSI